MKITLQLEHLYLLHFPYALLLLEKELKRLKTSFAVANKAF